MECQEQELFINSCVRNKNFARGEHKLWPSQLPPSKKLAQAICQEQQLAAAALIQMSSILPMRWQGERNVGDQRAGRGCRTPNGTVQDVEASPHGHRGPRHHGLLLR